MSLEKPGQIDAGPEHQHSLNTSDVKNKIANPDRFLVRNVDGSKQREQDEYTKQVILESLNKGERSLEVQSSSLEDQTSSMFSRLENPKIKEQLISLFEKKEEYLSTQDVVQPGAPIHDGFDFILNDDGTPKREDPVVAHDHTKYIRRPQQEIREQVDSAIEKQKTVTSIDFTNNENGSNANYEAGNVTIVVHPETLVALQDGVEISLKDIAPEKRTALLSAVEAHEKGHLIRYFKDEPGTSFFADYFRKGFTLDLKKSDFFYLFNSSEIAERMSQLKNYFGMKGADEFTSAHLQHAKEHYVTDTSLDNNMTQFFQAITPESEKDFLRIINNSGI